ncbi:MAG: 50S ribosomal protein L9 [Bacilli bacterium]|nr:50S ribosomal protein L9 [Bacilli bacterium]
MKVVLLQDVKGVGKKDQTVEVSDGYANNFLLPRRLGVAATKRSMEVLGIQQADAKKRDDDAREAAKVLAAKLDSITLEFQMTAGKDGRMFGSVSTKQVVEALRNQYQINIDKRKFLNDDTANVFGTTVFKNELYKGVIGNIKVHVVEKK